MSPPPVCAGCGQPIAGGYLEHRGQPYHPGCYARLVAPSCAYCGKPLLGRYLVDYWGTTFCPEHRGVYPTCRFCGRLIPPHHQEHRPNSTGEPRCATCRASAIESLAQAERVFARLVQWFHGQGLTCNNLQLSISLTDRAQLAQFHNMQINPDAWGITLHKRYVRAGQVMRTDVEGVAVLRGLPAILFQGVAIHELGHVWLAAHGVHSLADWAEEGFCELIAHRLYAQMTTPESQFHAQRIARNPDPVYGQGFRNLQAIEQQTGFPRLIETLRTTGKLPITQ